MRDRASERESTSQRSTIARSQSSSAKACEKREKERGARGGKGGTGRNRYRRCAMTVSVYRRSLSAIIQRRAHHHATLRKDCCILAAADGREEKLPDARRRDSRARTHTHILSFPCTSLERTTSLEDRASLSSRPGPAAGRGSGRKVVPQLLLARRAPLHSCALPGTKRERRGCERVSEPGKRTATALTSSSSSTGARQAKAGEARAERKKGVGERGSRSAGNEFVVPVVVPDRTPAPVLLPLLLLLMLLLPAPSTASCQSDGAGQCCAAAADVDSRANRAPID